MSGTDYTLTPNLGLYKPTVNADGDAWGGHWNQNADKLDIAVGTVNVKNYGAKGDGTTNDTAAIAAAAAAVPTTGGVLLFPPGVYIVTTVTLLKSNTTVQGAGATLLAAPTGFGANQPLLQNVNSSVTTLTDHDIAIYDLTFDYGSSGVGGSGHCINLYFVTNAIVSNCTFQLRGAGNATAMLGCRNTLVDGCTAYGFTNCAYDWWTNPQKARLTNCYAETASSVGFVNFNPENTTLGTSAGNVADGFIMSGNHFVCTGGTASSIQIEPLESGTTVRNVTITDNVFENVTLAMRGAVRSAAVRGNQFYSCLGGNAVVYSFTNLGGTPSDFVVSSNVITNPTTTGANGGVIRLGGSGVVAEGNRISGTTYSTYGIDTSAASRALVVANATQDGFYNGPLGASVLSVLLRATTTSTTPVVATADGAAPGANNVFNVIGYFVFKLRFDVIARTQGGATTCWFADNVIVTVAGSNASVTVSTATFTQGPTGTGGSTTGLAVAVTADTTNGGLRVACTGQAATNVDWAVLVTGLQVQ